MDGGAVSWAGVDASLRADMVENGRSRSGEIPKIILFLTGKSGHPK